MEGTNKITPTSLTVVAGGGFDLAADLRSSPRRSALIKDVFPHPRLPSTKTLSARGGSRRRANRRKRNKRQSM